MGSRATCLSGKFGGLDGRALKRGDQLHAPGIPPQLRTVGIRFPRNWIPGYEKETSLKVILGPQDDHFTGEGVDVFRSSVYRVTPQCDRTGIRFEGPSIARRPDVEESILSEGLLPGVIQVPGGGQPILILTETVTGGYAKIATVISADLNRVAQLKPGDSVRFEPVCTEEALRHLREQEGCLKALAGLMGAG
jgi:allophanate hydrolase subunit 2